MNYSTYMVKRFFVPFLFLILFLPSVQSQSQDKYNSTIPFDTPAIRYGDMEMSLGYFVVYEQYRLGRIQAENEEQRKQAMQTIVRSSLFEHKVADLARENGYTDENEYQVFNQDLQADWLSKFYEYHQFYKAFKPDENKLKARYEENKEDYHKPLQFTFRHIFFRTIDMPEEVKAEAKERAEKALALIRAGSDFVEIAKKFSDSSKKGALVGPLYSREYKPDQAINPKLEDALLSMKQGDVSDIIQTRYGYEILKLETLTPESYDPFERVKSRLIVQLRNEAFSRWKQKILFNHWPEAITKFNPQVLFDENADPNTLVLEVYGQTIPLADYPQLRGTNLKKSSNESESESEFEERVIKNARERIAYRYITAKLAKDLNYETIPAYQTYVKTYRIRQLYNTWWDRIVEQYLEENPITEEEMQAYYEKNSRMFLKPQKAHIGEMTFRITPKNEENKYQVFKAQQAAEEKAQLAISRLEQGKPFVDIARGLSESGTAERGGDVGMVDSRSEELPRRVLSQAVKLDEGEYTTEPIKDGDAYYVLICYEKPEREPMEFENSQIQQRCEQGILGEKRNEVLQEYMNKLVDPDKIEIVFDRLYTFNPSNLERIKLDPVEDASK